MLIEAYGRTAYRSSPIFITLYLSGTIAKTGPWHIRMKNNRKEDGLLQIIVNGEAQEVTLGCTVFELLKNKEITLKAAVVELNGQILKQELWQSTAINADDNLEILIFMGGG